MQDYRDVLDIDLVAPFIMAKHIVPGMIRRGHGKIINMCSMMSELGRDTVSAYAAAKGGLKMLTKSMATEWAKHNIQANGIGPGYFATEQTAPIRVNGHPFNDFIIQRTPAGRWGDPSDLAGTAVFLASKASDFVNGRSSMSTEVSWLRSENRPMNKPFVLPYKPPKSNIMKFRLFPFPGMMIVLMLGSCSGNQALMIRFSNHLETALQDQVIHIPAGVFADSIGEIPSGKLPVFISGQDTLPSQCIDYNHNGVPDEILVEISVPAKATLTAEIHYVPSGDYPAFVRKTNIRFARAGNLAETDTATRAQTDDTEVTQKIFQMEGPAWENDKVGFRNYFDLRNGMDIFGKQTPEIVLDSVGLNRRIEMPGGLVVGDIYHNLSSWGMDILKVANSLGAGSIALLVNDSIYRIGDNGRGTFKRLYEGPLQSEFMFGFPGWKAGGQSFDISQYISITAGEFRYKSSMLLNKDSRGAEFVTGIVNMHSDSLFVEKVSDHYTVLLTHAVQSEDTAMLTMALLIPTEELDRYGKTRDAGAGITQTFYARLKTRGGVPDKYWFYAFWATGYPEFKDLHNVLGVIRRDADLLENPVTVIRIR